MRLGIDELDELEEFVVLAQSILEIFEAGVTADAKVLEAPMTKLWKSYLSHTSVLNRLTRAYWLRNQARRINHILVS